MKLHELKQRLVPGSGNSESSGPGGTGPILPIKGSAIDVPNKNALNDPYWGTRPAGGVRPSPFTEALARQAEKSGRRVSPPGERGPTETTATVAKEGNKRFEEFYLAIEEASTGHCAYCGSDEPFVSSCIFCQPAIVHEAGNRVDHIFIDTGHGTVKRHWLRDGEKK